MSARTKYVIAGLVLGLVALWILPNWLAVLIIVGLLATPIVAYLLLDPSQRRRVRRVGRKQIGR
jgi:uncharacterized protein (DUF58 family)